MPPASLHTICLYRIYGLLREDTWKSCSVNPFEEIPNHEVNELMDITLLPSSRNPPQIGDVFLLLTSGKLTRLDLRPFTPENEQYLIYKVTHTRSFEKYLPYFDFGRMEYFIFLLMRIIVFLNPRLKEFHSHIDPGFDAFTSNLEILHLPNMDRHKKANVLERYPKLITIGMIDSLEGLVEIHRRRKINPLSNSAVGTRLQLLRCFWGSEELLNSKAYNSKFCRKVRFAVAMCSLLDQLVLLVHVIEALQELRFLRKLTLLRICFQKFKINFVQKFVSYFQETGSQLKHLSIMWRESSFETYNGTLVGAIFDYCPHLESLELYQIIFESEFSRRPAGTLKNLKRLTLYSTFKNKIGYIPDNKSLLFLLSNCKNLEELFLSSVKNLDDALLSQIFDENPFSKLKVVCAEFSSLTRSGYQMIIERVPSVKAVLINFHEGRYFYHAEVANSDSSIRHFENPNININLRDFFDRRLDRKRF